MKETHKDGHKKPDEAEKINITKTLYKFEGVVLRILVTLVVSK